MPTYDLIPIEQLIEPEMPAREGMDETKLAELRDSVKEIGFIHPLAVVRVPRTGEFSEPPRKTKTSKQVSRVPVLYEIADGHRRYKCGVMLSLKVLPCLIFEDRETAVQAVRLHANLFREDLSVAEEAAFISDLIVKYDYTEEQLCRALHAKVSWINERIGILRGNQDVFNALRERKINLAVAKQLNRVSAQQRIATARGEKVPENLPTLASAEQHTKYLLSLAVEGGATALTVSHWVNEFLRPKPESQEATVLGAAITEGRAVAASETVCFFCRKPDNPYNLQNVWIHEWELRMIQANLDAAARVPPPHLAETENQTEGK